MNSSAYAKATLRLCEGGLQKRAQIAWDTTRAVLDSEGFTPTEDNKGQIRVLLEEAVTSDSADLHDIYDIAKSAMSGNWPDLSAARSHAIEPALGDADIDLLGRKARRPPLEDELSAPRYQPAREHWRKALGLAGNAPPDLENAVKEAASAVESLAQVVLGKPGLTLGDAIKQLRSSRLIPAGADHVLEGLWTFANASPGVRHGSALAANTTESHWTFARTITEAGMRLLLDVDTT